MRNLYRRILALTAVFLVVTAISGCGCGKKSEPEAESSQVIKLTITPEATPTLAPDQINADAVTRTGNLTMVNSYLAENQGETEITEADTDQAEDGSDDNQE